MSTDTKPVTSITTPIEIEYEWSAGPGGYGHISGLLDGRLVGRRCSVCSQVYFPPRGGVCPRDGEPFTDDVELAEIGTISSYCIVNVEFPGQRIPIPYVAANITLDGADVAVPHLVSEIAADQVRIGMRVEAAWRPRDEWGPTLENIAYFRPVGAAAAAGTEATS